MNKLILNCTTGEVKGTSFTSEELAQREYEASLPPVIPQETEFELLQEQVDINAGAIDYIVMNF